MTDTILLRESELLSHFEQAGIDLQTMVRAVLECTPTDESGKTVRWPDSSRLTVRDLVNQRVTHSEWPDRRAARGLHFMAQVVAARTSAIAMFVRGPARCQVLMSDVQVEEIFKAVRSFILPHCDQLVAPMLRHFPAADGFFASYKGNGPDALEAILHTMAGGGAGVQRLADEPFENSRLVIWRHARSGLASCGERVVDSHVVLYGADGRQQAFARLRYVKLARGTLARDLVFILDAYDDLGLELGAALQDACEHGALNEDELTAGLPLVQVQELEVRQDMRGAGLGLRLLKRSLQLAATGVRAQPRRLVMAVKPLQFDFPLRGMPADMLLEALDAVSALQQHIEASRPQDVLKSLKGTENLYLGVDERATSTHFRQLTMLAGKRA